MTEATRRMGEAYPQIVNIARNYSTLLNLTQRFETSYALLQRAAAAAAASDDELARSSYLESLAVAAMNTGHVQESVAAMTESVELALNNFGRDPEALKFALDQYAWVLFETGEVKRAAQMAAYLIDNLPDPPTRSRTIVVLAAELGLAPPGPERGDSDLAPEGCSGAELKALRARLVLRQAPEPSTVPEDCNAPRALRLVALGLKAAPPAGHDDFPAEPLRSPFARIATAEPGLWPISVDAPLAERVDRIYQRLTAAN